MKVILRSDIENLGRLGDVVQVKPGYGRNYLLPQGFAMLASPANLKVFELERKKLQAKVESLRGTAASLAEKIAAVKLSIAMRVGENDKLYGSVTPALIADALAEQGIVVDRRRVLLDAPIRALGERVVRIRLHADVVAELQLAIVPERVHHAEDVPAKQADHGSEQPAPSETATE
jgi:large subunit ribosomal protein L9